MPTDSFPFAVRLIGFNHQETEIFEATFALGQSQRCAYVRLAEGNLQDPDLYIANAEDLRAVVKLADLNPSDVRPALLVGQPLVALPYARVDRPIRWQKLFQALEELIIKRADALSRLEASDIVSVPERRRRDRVDIDLSDPADYRLMRIELAEGAVLVIDKTKAFRDYVAELTVRNQVEVLWAGNEDEALEVCRQQRIATVLINTSLLEIDAYRLCALVKAIQPGVRTSVILLVARPNGYDARLGRQVGCEGFLTKPVAGHHLVTTLKKFMRFPR